MPTTNCATCQHPQDVHSDLVGCTHNDDTHYCTCAQFVPTADLAEGRARRDEGVARINAVDDDAAQNWRADAEEALTVLIGRDREFSADDLVEVVGEPPRPNMLGGLFIAASRRNRIKAVGFRQATRPSAHARIQRTWEGA